MSKVYTDNIEKRTGGTEMAVPATGKWPQANIADDAVGIAQLAATGTASATTFLRGDNSWADVDTTGIQANMDDIALLAFQTQANGSLARYNLVDQFVDAFEDATGVDSGSSTNDTRNISGKYYSGNSAPTGGTELVHGSYTSHTFLADGEFISPAGTVDIFMVGGGAGGGGVQAAGGGAGGFRTWASHSVVNATYTITVADGGLGGAASGGNTLQMGRDGGTTTMAGTGFTTISIGGGGGGGTESQSGNNSPEGSGGGASYSNSTSPGTGGSYGNDGGNGYSSAPNWPSGGGGGAGAVGGTAGSGSAGGGAGGIGSQNDYRTGSNVYYAGGGGGNGYESGNDGAGGNGGGGAGVSGGSGGTGIGVAGTANTGGGGGGGGYTNGVGGAGGSGIVVIRRLTTMGGTVNMTLVSNSTTAQAAPTKADLVFTYTNGAGTAVLGTNITAEASMDGGTTWTDFSIGASDSQGTTGGHTIVAKHDVALTSTSGTAMRYRVKTLVQSTSMDTRIHAVSLGWS